MKIIFLLLIFCISNKVYSAPHVSVGVYRNLNDTQEESGEIGSDPFYPMIQLGYNFSQFWKVVFSPQFFYVFSSKNSNDSSGGDYSSRTYGLLFDFLYPFNSRFALRLGLGNIITSIEGDGGTVSVPNGSGTSIAYKPGKESKSYTGTINLGLDVSFNNPYSALYFKNAGLRFEYLMTSPTRKEQRSGSLAISLQGYF